MKKRLIDITGSLVAGMVLSPMLAAISGIVAVKFGRPIIVKEPHIGKDGKLFDMYTFRTAPSKRDIFSYDENLGDAAWLRSSQIVGLPKLYNVFKGDLSFVGPTPHRAKNGPLNLPRDREEILSVRPGLTGPAHAESLAQKRDLPLSIKLKLDFDYAVKPTSLKEDFAIIWKTAKNSERKYDL